MVRGSSLGEEPTYGRQPDDNQHHRAVLHQGVALVPHQGPHDHHGDDLAALEDDLGGVVQVQEGQVGEVDGGEAVRRVGEGGFTGSKCSHHVHVNAHGPEPGGCLDSPSMKFD